MILGVLVAGKRYPAVKYLFVLMIVMGVALFIYKDKKEGTPSENRGVIGPGEILLVSKLVRVGQGNALLFSFLFFFSFVVFVFVSVFFLGAHLCIP